jgi:surfeit locus 1 family protein
VITTRASARTIAAIVVLLTLAASFAALGAWQLRRAEASSATRAQFDGGVSEAMLATLPSSLDANERFRRLEVGGEYVGRPQFLLDNMLHDGVAGYHVVTALRVPGRSERVLVNRGWVPAGEDRRVLPVVEVDEAHRVVSGRLERLPRPGLRLGAEHEARIVGGDSTVLQYPTANELAALLGAPVLDYQLLLDAELPDGFVREWRAPGVAPERHLAYAGQWLLLATGAAGVAVVMIFKVLRRKP